MVKNPIKELLNALRNVGYRQNMAKIRCNFGDPLHIFTFPAGNHITPPAQERGAARGRSLPFFHVGKPFSYRILQDLPLFGA